MHEYNIYFIQQSKCGDESVSMSQLGQTTSSRAEKNIANAWGDGLTEQAGLRGQRASLTQLQSQLVGRVCVWHSLALLGVSRVWACMRRAYAGTTSRATAGYTTCTLRQSASARPRGCYADTAEVRRSRDIQNWCRCRRHSARACCHVGPFCTQLARVSRPN